MKIRYPGPSVPPERREQAEYVPAFALPLPVGVVVDVPDAHGEALMITGLVEQVEESPAAVVIEIVTGPDFPASGPAPPWVIEELAANAAALESGLLTELPDETEPPARRKR